MGCAGSPAAQEFKQETASEKTQKEVQEDSSINAKVITPQTSIKKIENGLSIVQFEGNDGVEHHLSSDS